MYIYIYLESFFYFFLFSSFPSEWENFTQFKELCRIFISPREKWTQTAFNNNFMEKKKKEKKKSGKIIIIG